LTYYIGYFREVPDPAYTTLKEYFPSSSLYYPPHTKKYIHRKIKREKINKKGLIGKKSISLLMTY
jgi:hypothetical protein